MHLVRCIHVHMIIEHVHISFASAPKKTVLLLLAAKLVVSYVHTCCTKYVTAHLIGKIGVFCEQLNIV